MIPRSVRATVAPVYLLASLLFAAAVPAPAAEPVHPVLSIPGSGSGADSILTTYSEAQFLRFVPEWAPRDSLFTRAVVPGDSGWSWNPANPDQLTSTPSGTIFPNATYPIQYEPVSVLSGKTIDVPYYFRAGSTTNKSLVFGYISYQKRAQLRKFFGQLAAAYVQSGTSPETRNDAYARRIAVALDAWANHVPDYYLTAKNNPTFIHGSPSYVLTSDIQRASDHNGMAHEWHESELFAFDAIYDSQAIADLSVERGYDVRAHIRDNLFCNIGDYFKDRVPVSLAIATNLSSPFSILAKTARVLNRPDYILWMGDYLDATIRRKILRDGVLPEGIGYSWGYLNENKEATTATRDYFLTRPADTVELEEVFLAANRYVPIIDGGLATWRAASLPDGTHSSFGDTNFNTVMTGRNAGNTVLLPAYGHLAFGTGGGAQAVQLNQNFSDDSNHMRADVTAFTLWANHAELLGNVRYYNSLPGRNFTEQILSHNAVTIDRSNMSRGSWNVGNNNHRFTSGNLTLFEPMNHGLSVSEVDGQRAYTNKASRYQRFMILNTVDPNRPYVVDVFRLAGGTTHDYTLHGAIRYDQTAETSLSLTPMAGQYPLLEGGETWVEPTSSGSSFPYYGYFRNMSQGVAADRFQITYRDTTGSKRDTRLWMAGEAGSTVYLGVTPNPSRTNTTPSNFYTHWRPSTIVRHRVASGPLHSLYAGVVEPLANGVSTIQAVTRLPLTTDDQEAVALRVWFTDGRFDTYLINLRNSKIAGADGGSDTIATADGEYSLTGRFGAYVSRAAAESRVWTIGASHFKYGAHTATAADTILAGNIIGMTRQYDGANHDAFVVDAPLPIGTALQGRQLSLTFGDYPVVNSSTIQRGISEMFEIDRVEQIGGVTHVILKDDHQLKIVGDTTVEQVAPERTFTGANTFEIVLSASAATVSSPTPEPPAPLPSPEPPDPTPTTEPAKVAIPAANVVASAAHSSFPAALAVDGNLATRWAGNGDGVTLRLDLGKTTTIAFVKIAFFQGNSRTYTFDLQTSLDGDTWTTLLDRADNGATAGLETFDFPHTEARYVRLVGHGNSKDSYTNVFEIEVWAYDRPPLSAPEFTPAAGQYASAQEIALSTTSSDASIRYTLDGSTPSATNGITYSGPFVLDYTTTVKAITLGTDVPPSGVANADYVVGPLAPEKLSIVAVSAQGSHASFPPANAIDDNLSTRWAASGDGVYLQCDLGEVKTLNYAKLAFFNGTSRTYSVDLLVSDDGENWTAVFERRSNSATTDLESFHFPRADGRYVRIVGHLSSVDSYTNLASLELWGTDPVPTPAAPVFTPVGGTYNQEQAIALSTDTAGATIRYTLDGTTPSRTHGTLYTEPVWIIDLGTTVMKAIAYRDDTFDSAIARASYELIDNTPPVLTLPEDVVAEATGPGGATVSFTVGAEDDFDGVVPATASPASGGVFPLGMTPVTVTASDASGNVATDTFDVLVRDTTAPAFQSLAVSRAELWPANHKMVPITVAATLADIVDQAPQARIVSVTSNEPVNGQGDGNTSPDWAITGDLTVELRAERAGGGTGRIYTITVEARDASANASTRTATVMVPHDRGRN